MQRVILPPVRFGLPAVQSQPSRVGWGWLNTVHLLRSRLARTLCRCHTAVALRQLTASAPLVSENLAMLKLHASDQLPKLLEV